MDAPLIAGRYEIVRALGRGSFAETLLARDRGANRQVAIKVLHPRAALDLKSFELFSREAAVLRDLRHPAIPAVFDTFRAPYEGAEAAFLVMEFIEGDSLAERIAARRHLDPADALHLFVEMLGVLEYLHTRVPPVLHRDIKPANVIVRPDGSPALVDFGAVRNVFRPAEESGSTIVGTYGYMPYEQLMGQAGPSSDLYALGATFLHLVTGRRPPDFMTDAGRLEVPAALPCGEPLRSVLVRLLAAAPAERFQSARQARNALLAGGAGAVPAPVPVSSPPISLGSVVPRPMTGETARLWRQVGHSTWELMAPDEKPGTRWSIADWFLVAFFSTLTAGILPLTFYSVSRSRRKRLRAFLTFGLPATARVLEMTDEEVAFEKKLTRVRYEFEVDGRRFRDADLVLPSIAERWDPGTLIQILYLPDRDYDSAIISTS
jgi:serine/threonine protein kinase